MKMDQATSNLVHDMTFNWSFYLQLKDIHEPVRSQLYKTDDFTGLLTDIRPIMKLMAKYENNNKKTFLPPSKTVGNKLLSSDDLLILK